MEYSVEEIQDSLRRIWKPSVTKIFVATNHKLSHPIIVGLKELYGDQLLLWDDFESTAGTFIRCSVSLMSFRNMGAGTY